MTKLNSISTQAIYDILHALTGAGLVRRVEPAGSPARFELQTGDNHHHLVCRRCGSITDVSCAAGAAPCLQTADGSGFHVDEAEVTFWGLCLNCQSVDQQPKLIGEHDDHYGTRVNHR